MFPLNYHYEDVSRQDLLLKGNYHNVMQVPGLSSIRVVPKATSKAGKLAMEIPRGQKFIETQTGVMASRSNPFLGKGTGEDLARQTTLRGQAMAHFLVRVSTVMALLDYPVDIRKGSIHFSIERELCELSPELEDHFEIFEHSPGFDVTLATSANTQDETLPLWTAFLQKDEG